MKARQTSRKTRAQLLNELENLPLNSRIDENHVAAARNCSVATVQQDRIKGKGVPFIREGGEIATVQANGKQKGQTRRFGCRVHYLKSDLLKFLESRNKTYTSTTEADQHQGAAA